MDMYFRQFWRDPRLSFERRPGADKLVVGADYAKQVKLDIKANEIFNR